MPRIARSVLTALLIALLVSGCGNKGPLVLPDQAPKAKKAHADKDKSATATPAPESGASNGRY